MEEIFHNRAVARCPTCSVDRREADYIKKTFDRGEVHREVHIRTHDVKDFQYVRLEDMDPSLSETERLDAYNDFLEAAEDIAYNLSFHQDVAKTKENMKALYAQWEDVIVQNKRAAELERQQREMERRVRWGACWGSARERLGGLTLLRAGWPALALMSRPHASLPLCAASSNASETRKSSASLQSERRSKLGRKRHRWGGGAHSAGAGDGPGHARQAESHARTLALSTPPLFGRRKASFTGCFRRRATSRAC